MSHALAAVRHARVHTAPAFSDDPLVAGTRIQTRHVQQLRDAIDLALAAAGDGTADYTNTTLDHVAAVDVMEMRSALAHARTDLNLKPIVFTDPTLSSSIAIRHEHIQELRDGVRLTLDPPAISSFTASPATLPPHAPAQLTAVFSGGSAVVSNNLNATTFTLTSGVPTQVTITQSITFTLTVSNTLGDSVTAPASVTAEAPTIALSHPAPGTTQLTAVDDVRCTPTCPKVDPLLYALAATTTAVDGSTVTFYLNSDDLGASVTASNGSVTDVQRELPNGPSQRIQVRVTDPYGNVYTTPSVFLDINSAQPVASDDQYDIVENGALTVGAPGVLTNDDSHRGLISSYGATDGTEQSSFGTDTPTTAGGTVSMDQLGGFHYTPLPGYVGTDSFHYVIANVNGSSTAQVSVLVYSPSCGSNPAQLAIGGGPLPVKGYDPRSFTATVISDDNNPAVCPARFGDVYTFQWSIDPPATRYMFHTIVPTGPTSSQASIAIGDSSLMTLRVAATAGRTNITTQQTLSVAATCFLPPVFIGQVTVSTDESGYADKIFRDSVVSLQPTVSLPCETDPMPTYDWHLSAPDNATLSNPSAATTTFKSLAPMTPYFVGLTVYDHWGHQSMLNPPLFLSSQQCGASPVLVSLFSQLPPKPMDPWMITAFPNSDDDNPAVCPPRFAATYSMQWVVSPADGSTFTSPTALMTSFLPHVPASYSITGHVTSSSGATSMNTVPIDTTCNAPMGFVEVTSNQPAPVGSVVTLQADATSYCLTSPGFQYEWSVTPNADGTTISANGNTASFTPLSAVKYTVHVKATDASGLFATTSVDIFTVP